MEDHTHAHNHAEHSDYGMKEHYGLRDFLPLIGVFAVVIVLAGVLVVIHGSSGALYLMRAFMGSFFVVFGLLKVINWRGFVDAYSTYDLITKQVRAYGWAYPIFELGLGILYIAGVALTEVAIFTVVLMLVSVAGVFNELRKKNQIPCACLGAVFKVPMTWVTLGEDLLMAAMALVILLMV